MITYISSTRFIEGNGVPREDAVGFSDFNVSRGAFVGMNQPTFLYARVEAAQTSRLLSDRIEVNCSTLTQFIQNPQGNSISARSSFDIRFVIDEATQVTLNPGPIFSQSNGGSASVSLLSASGTQILVATGSPLDPPFQQSVLQPGEYRFVGGCSSGSLQSVVGPAQTVATLTIPPTSAGMTGLVGLVAASIPRNRRLFK